MSRFTLLRDFLQHKMKPQALYQPVMLKTLLKSGGSAPNRKLALALMQNDDGQIEYYEKKALRNMVGKVLAKHQLVERLDGAFKLVGFEDLSATQVEEFAALCDQAKADFLEKMGGRPFGRRFRGDEAVSGNLRHAVLKRAHGRCELCGARAEIRRLEVDDIVPKSKGGGDEEENLQALCFECNGAKGNRDREDFRPGGDWAGHFQVREASCVFCAPERIVDENELAYCMADKFPVSPGHHLVMPKRHIESYFELLPAEMHACTALLKSCQKRLAKAAVRGFNVGINDGPAAGQTVPHAHIHLIPRRAGDHPEPRGGVRAVMLGKAGY